MTANLLSAAAIAISLVSFVINFLSSSAADRRGRMPVLVLKRLPSDEKGISHVLLTNVGTGPALNIIFGLAEEAENAGPKQLRRRVRGRWFSPLHLFPIPPGGELDVAHPETSNVMGATYKDALGSRYTVKASQYGTRIHEGRHLPKAWRMLIVPPMWQTPPTKHPWLRTNPGGRTLEHPNPTAP
jgi:hypothetical protein